MEFDLEHMIASLERIPRTLQSLLRDLPEAWVLSNEGPDTWSPFDVIGHLAHTERTAWIPRAKIILEHGTSRAFEPIDRFAQFEASKGKTLNELLDAFETFRRSNIAMLRSLNLTSSHLALQGKHPEFGVVTLGQLLETWTVHDLNHIGQIVQVMARQRTDAVGPWKAFLPILGVQPTS
ncbi:MAG: DinB family protein [Anaerolineae bacterium]